MSGKAMLQCAGGGQTFFVVVDDEKEAPGEDRCVKWSRGYNGNIRTRLADVMERVLASCRGRGITELGICPSLEHELTTHNLGFDPHARALVRF